MTSDVPRPKQDPKRQQGFHEPSPSLSPAQAIAEAWQRESSQSQELWRQADSKVRELYSAPRPQVPRKGQNGKM
ncbi:hypothetical protein SERLA73DRAFT_89355 [Serpula lacrymans var. lacrymans S7.3]|uniref:HMG box domain-containing protein n=2 Tax=Serpula lacrymans var. lacrymans TaxID=341189 RepID=F8PU73_SERL3|nr:uncharacterized protein SERLADRAFT_388677 [Serpula lacrymans var. lacrymans S7.9]EGO00386.1 hypothetical protein SERLA73DRAFT_89355 [Serpula lacrymans var. lacrymans S7.3]EGO25948.1 hypothetical protein SERLADRAFT_388677 [Serpula lacrymans var. lacrymans S7.9]